MIVDQFRAWNKKLEIMVYNNEDDDRGTWDGVRSSCVEMVNHLLGSSIMCDTYIWMQIVYMKKNGQVFYEGDILEHPNGFQRFYIKEGTYHIGYALYDCANGQYHCTLNEEHFDRYQKAGNIYEDKHLLGEWIHE